MKIKQGDTVEVISGNDRGKRGEVLRVLSTENRVVVQGVNVRKKHQRQQQTQGGRSLGAGIVKFDAPLAASRVMVVCPKCSELSRMGYHREPASGKAMRVCRNCKAEIDA